MSESIGTAALNDFVQQAAAATGRNYDIVIDAVEVNDAVPEFSAAFLAAWPLATAANNAHLAFHQPSTGTALTCDMVALAGASATQSQLAVRLQNGEGGCVDFVLQQTFDAEGTLVHVDMVDPFPQEPNGGWWGCMRGVLGSHMGDLLTILGVAGSALAAVGAALLGQALIIVAGFFLAVAALGCLGLILSLPVTNDPVA